MDDDVGTGSRFSNALTKKLGPLPGYAWVGLAVGGFLVYHKLKTGSFIGTGSTAAAPSTDTTGNGLLDAGGSFGGGVPAGGGGAGAGFFTDPSQLADTTPPDAGLQSQMTNPDTNLLGQQTSDAGVTAYVAPVSPPVQQSNLLAPSASSLTPSQGSVITGLEQTASGSGAKANDALTQLSAYTAAEPAPSSFAEGILQSQNTPIYIHSTILQSPSPGIVTPTAGGGEIASGAAGVQRKETTVNFQARRQL